MAFGLEWMQLRKKLDRQPWKDRLRDAKTESLSSPTYLFYNYCHKIISLNRFTSNLAAIFLLHCPIGKPSRRSAKKIFHSKSTNSKELRSFISAQIHA